ncbi:hypothetical protein CLF_109821 [Clonorchis sinensis]|uniref:DUF4817 domain-containing protein n=1 Tax=Clonorchis sinensis TaxID=79923 RepID=G7YSY8_CLOSI|nr:hypothetical protein CLF_109821 [Clonorchis sinensis]
MDVSTRIEIVKLYYSLGESATAALRGYKIKHGLIKDPFTVSTITRLIAKFEFTGCLLDFPGKGRRSLSDERAPIVQNAVEQIQSQSTMASSSITQLMRKTLKLCKCTYGDGPASVPVIKSYTSAPVGLDWRIDGYSGETRFRVECRIDTKEVMNLEMTIPMGCHALLTKTTHQPFSLSMHGKEGWSFGQAIKLDNATGCIPLYTVGLVSGSDVTLNERLRLCE